MVTHTYARILDIVIQNSLLGKNINKILFIKDFLIIKDTDLILVISV